MGLTEEHGRVALAIAEVEARMCKLKHDAREYEFRYELSSDRMRQRLDKGKERKTKDVLNWMSIFEALQRLQSEYPHVNVKTPTPAIEWGLDPDSEISADEDFEGRARRRIAKFEAIYEMESQEMLELLSDFRVRETAEIIKWLLDYQYVRYSENPHLDPEGIFGATEMTDAEVAEQIENLKLNINYYEDCYNMTSDQMLALLRRGEIEETIEIIEWKFDLRDLHVMEKEIPTTGKPTTATSPSTIGN